MDIQITGSPNLDQCFIEKRDEHLLIYGSWQDQFACWKSDIHLRFFQPMVPSWALFDYVDSNHALPMPALKIQKHPESNLDFSDFVTAIPPNIRTLVLPMGPYQWLGLDAIYHVPEFMQFIEQEQEHVGFGFLIGAFILGNALEKPLLERKILYNKIRETSRETLLSMFLDLPCKKRFIRILNHIPVTQLSKESIWILYHVSTSLKLYTCAHTIPNLDIFPLSLAYYELPEWLMIPSVLQALHTMPKRMNSLDSVFPGFILHANKHNQAAIIQSLKDANDFKTLEQRLYQLTQHLKLRAKFPEPPFPGSTLLTPISTGKALQQEGLAMHNCVPGFAEDILEGKTYFYHWHGAEEATVQLMKTNDNIWYPKEYLGWNNSELKDTTILEIICHLANQAPSGELVLQKCQVAGLAYYDAEEAWQSIHPEDILLLKRELDNPYDEQAIEVYSKNQVKLGYVPKVYNSLPAFLMDSDVDVSYLIQGKVVSKRKSNYRTGHIYMQLVMIPLID